MSKIAGEFVTCLDENLLFELEAIGIEKGNAQNAIARIIAKLQHAFGGCNVYFPKVAADNESRNDAIRKKFTGNNHAQLAREFGLTERYIYTILR